MYIASVSCDNKIYLNSAGQVCLYPRGKEKFACECHETCSCCPERFCLTVPEVSGTGCDCLNIGGAVFDIVRSEILNAELEFVCQSDWFSNNPGGGFINFCDDREGLQNGFASIVCDDCEWILTETIGTQGVDPFIEITFEARKKRCWHCPPLGEWLGTCQVHFGGAAVLPCTIADCTVVLTEGVCS